VPIEHSVERVSHGLDKAGEDRDMGIRKEGIEAMHGELEGFNPII
jgi:hypothetical protein